MKIKKTSVYIFLLQMGLFLLLEIAYVFYIAPHYSDLGFLLQQNLFRYFAAKLMLITVLVFITYFSLNDFMYSVLQMIVSFLLIPNLILYEFMDANIAIVLGIISMPVFTIALKWILPAPRFKPLVKNHRLYLLYGLALILLIPFFFTFGFGISSKVFLLDVYDIREKGEMSSNILTRYSYSFLSSWLLPLCIIYGFLFRKKALMLVAMMALLYLFAVTGNKITFFVIFVILCFLIFNDFRSKLIAMYSALLVIFSIGLLISDFFPAIEDLLIRRFLFLPALLNIQYFEFFESPVYYSHSFLSTVLNYPYLHSPSQEIGLKLYEGKGNMTNGIISDGYLNLGVLGIFLHVFIASCIITFFSKLRIDAVFLGLFFLLVQNFIDSPIFTSLLTHGLFAFMLISLFTIRNTEKNLNHNA